MNTLRLRISTRALRVNDRDWLETCVRWLWITLFGVSFCLLFYGPATVDAAAPAVDIEVINEGNRSILAPQEWAEVLGKAGFSRVSIRSKRLGDTPGVENIGTAQFPRYRVVAFLRNDRLVFPSGDQFNQREFLKIKQWLRNLQQGGDGSGDNTQSPFGLSATQLDRARQQMSAQVNCATDGMELAELIDRLHAEQRLPLAINKSQREKIVRSATSSENLKGLATGTALAALLRPLGLGLHPIGGADRWRVIEKTNKNQVWPVGWDSDQSAARTVPMLGKQVETQKVTLPLRDAMIQLAARMGVPILLDARELNRAGVKTNANVTMRAGRFIHSAVLRQLLRQHQLTFAVRLDDAAQPFLWVSTFASLQPDKP